MNDNDLPEAISLLKLNVRSHLDSGMHTTAWARPS
jgi:hypothetical protein